METTHNNNQDRVKKRSREEEKYILLFIVSGNLATKKNLYLIPFSAISTEDIHLLYLAKDLHINDAELLTEYPESDDEDETAPSPALAHAYIRYCCGFLKSVDELSAASGVNDHQWDAFVSIRDLDEFQGSFEQFKTNSLLMSNTDIRLGSFIYINCTDV